MCFHQKVHQGVSEPLSRIVGARGTLAHLFIFSCIMFFGFFSAHRVRYIYIFTTTTLHCVLCSYLGLTSLAPSLRMHRVKIFGVKYYY